MDYKKLLINILPKMEYKYSDDKIITYDICYNEVSHENNYTTIWLNFNRIEDDSRVVVAEKILKYHMYSELSEMSKYVPLLKSGYTILIGTPELSYDSSETFI